MASIHHVYFFCRMFQKSSSLGSHAVPATRRGNLRARYDGLSQLWLIVLCEVPLWEAKQTFDFFDRFVFFWIWGKMSEWRSVAQLEIVMDFSRKTSRLNGSMSNISSLIHDISRAFVCQQAWWIAKGEKTIPNEAIVKRKRLKISQNEIVPELVSNFIFAFFTGEGVHNVNALFRQRHLDQVRHSCGSYV